MLKIRSEQLEVFKALDESQAVDKLQAFLQHCDCMPSGPADANRNLVTQWIGRARGYGLNTEYDIAIFLILTATLGDSFESKPQHKWASAIVANGAKPGHLKALQLRKHCEPYVAAAALGAFAKMENGATG